MPTTSLTVRVAARPGPRTDAWLKAFLAAAFAWTGTVVLPLFLRSPVALGVGAPLFLLVAVLFAIDIQRGKTAFRLPGTPWGLVAEETWAELTGASI